MKHSLFLIVLPYGEHELEYCIDDAGTPVLVEKFYKIIHHGPSYFLGDEPGPLEEETERNITFSELRKAARKKNAELFFDINEENWQELVEKHENHQSFLRQKDILDWRLKREKISREEYDERLHELIERTGEYEE
ncbi:MAG: hypothetical protein IJH99_06770 [Eubacterium sp.]|nr:hypothetical protein [Eubacterium sp.]